MIGHLIDTTHLIKSKKLRNWRRL